MLVYLQAACGSRLASAYLAWVNNALLKVNQASKMALNVSTLFRAYIELAQMQRIGLVSYALRCW